MKIKADEYLAKTKRLCEAQEKSLSATNTIYGEELKRWNASKLPSNYEYFAWLENAVGHLCGQVTHLAYALEQAQGFLPDCPSLKHSELIETSRKIVRAIEDGNEWPMQEVQAAEHNRVTEVMA